MSSHEPASAGWASARGDKWSTQLAGMEATLAPVDAPLLAALGIDAPCRIADVGCGGGGTTLALHAHAPAGSIVHGFDISPRLVELARTRIPPGADDVAFEVADVATFTPAAAYDRLVSRFGIMFFDDEAAAFANLARWLVPGGRFAFAAWGPAADNPWMTETRDVVGALVDLPPVEPTAPGPFRYGAPAKLLAQLAAAGFADLHVQSWRETLPIAGGRTPSDAAQFALRAYSNFDELLTAAGTDARAEATRRLTARFERHVVDGVVCVPAHVQLFTGSRARA